MPMAVFIMYCLSELHKRISALSQLKKLALPDAYGEIPFLNFTQSVCIVAALYFGNLNTRMSDYPRRSCFRTEQATSGLFVITSSRRLSISFKSSGVSGAHTRQIIPAFLQLSK